MMSCYTEESHYSIDGANGRKNDHSRTYTAHCFLDVHRLVASKLSIVVPFILLFVLIGRLAKS